ncbi:MULTISPECIES: hypothetical protein [unclassified Rhizobium]|uniref:hypothetical protein n=1 Tax=unclassified Rhizobium TaxID=2613769 RepID=UPI0006FB700A|nr:MULTISPECIES: hypothetical protein [unclassified Rhizobium]KQV39169.1 hypothetical protein ASC86_23160 [Rhizobium sp. Root1212]KRD35143.1 hypothetical protein ASE37_21730 [Rhizobium sp. Root268]
MRKIFIEAYIPETCWIEDAALWVAFGTLPEAITIGDVDARQDPAYFLDREADMDTIYSQGDFEAAGVNIDYDRYLEFRLHYTQEQAEKFLREARLPFDSAAINEGLTGVRSIFEGHEDLEEQVEFFERHALESNQHTSEAIEDFRSNFTYAMEAEDALLPYLDRARSLVFQKLSAGALKARGWIDKEPADAPYPIPAEEYGAFEDIPATSWTLTRLNWPASSLGTRGKTFNHVQMRTDNLFEIFPNPMVLEGSQVAGTAYGGCLILDNGTSPGISTMPRAGRGRPSMGGGDIRTAVINNFKGKFQCGELPGTSAEAAVAEIQEWVAKLFNKRPARATIQDWIKLIEAEALKDHSRPFAGNSAGK